MSDNCEYIIRSTIGRKKYIIAKILYSYDKENGSEKVLCKPVKSRWEKINVDLPDFRCMDDIKKFVNSEYAKSIGITLEQCSGKKSMSPEKRMYYLLEYLKKKTDKNHPLNEMKSIKEYFEKFEEDAKLNSYSTIKKTILELADVLNYDKDGVPTGREHIIFEESFNDDEKEDINKKQISRIKNLYYQSDITDYEMDQLIEAIHFSPSIKDSKKLIDKLKQNFASDHYIHRTDIDSYIVGRKDSRHIYENLSIIQEAIIQKCKIKFSDAFYDRNKQLRVNKDYHTVSPYKILSSDGKYYLYCFVDGDACDFFRIEYMGNIEILFDEKINPYGFDPITTLFADWVADDKSYKNVLDFTEADAVGMMDMTCINLTKYLVRVYNNDEMHVGYGFLMDTFGTHWEYIKKDEDGFDLIEINANPYAMVGWALKNADKIEIIEPIMERERIKGFISLLHDIYFT